MESTQGLKPGTYLRHGTYRIVDVLGQGGFGITYLAFDINLHRYVAIKEFFPKEYCDRESDTSHVTLGTRSSAQLVNSLKAKFLKEARNIAKFDYPGIIRIHAAFEENNTAYYVMDYIEGQNLYEMVRKNGPIEEGKALEYIRKVGETLEYLHGNQMNHLDVKPANILIRKSDDTPILIDFGLSKQYDSDGHQTSFNVTGVSHGFAPTEQYYEGGIKEFSPQTDLYSLAATLYFILSGVVPPQASRLNEEKLKFPSSIPSNLAGPISKAMSVSRKNRQESVREFLTELDESDSEDLTVITNHQYGKKSNRVKKIEKIFGLIAVLIFVIYIIDSSCCVKVPAEGPLEDEDIEILEIVQAIDEEVELDKYADKEKQKIDCSDQIIESDQTLDPVIQNLINNMVYVEGGTFMMGSDEKEAWRNEKPKHSESVASFSIGKYEVTQKEWRAVMGSNPSDYKGDNRPVEKVSWNDCMDFVNKLNKLTGINFRLPTEIEWEYAARGGTHSNGYKYSGSDDLSSVAWLHNNDEEGTYNVGIMKSNELGIHDMSGNVSEWTSSKWSKDYSKPRDSEEVVIRGGDSNSYDSEIKCRVSFRFSGVTENWFRLNSVGLRLAY